jgi:hypothetical protein
VQLLQDNKKSIKPQTNVKNIDYLSVLSDIFVFSTSKYFFRENFVFLSKLPRFDEQVESS